MEGRNVKPIHTVRLALMLLVCLAPTTSSCARRSPMAPDATRATSAASVHLAVSAPRVTAETTFEGDIGPGAHYVISVPEAWNGDLVLYAHGYTAPIFPVGIPPGEEVLVEGLRSIALQGGFAFAYSSYSQTGLGLKDAAQRTDQLASIFGSLVGPPQRTFLVGTSFGGLVALKLVEAHPERFAGLLTLCGMLGGVRAEIDYISHMRVLFDYFYPGVLPGNVYELPADFDLQQDLVGPASDAIQSNSQPAILMTQITQTPIPFSNGPELGQSIIQALALQAIELQDLLDRTHGQGFFDNTQTVYTGNLPPELLADLNARVARYSDGPAAAHFLAKYYEPTGDLRVPLVSLHTSLDPVVPILHEPIYRSLVEGKGLGANLHQTTVERYGHCMFTPEEIVGAFGQMISMAGRQSLSSVAP
jgi:pimeloyl-ACP methyl ester carboxylesterase